MNVSDKKRKLLLINSIFATLTSMSDLLFFALLILIGRFVGTENFGVFNSGLAITSIAIYVINLGLDSLAIRYISAEKTDTQFLMGSILAWKSIIALILSIIFFPAIILSVDDSTSQYVFCLLLFAAIIRSYNATMRAFLQGHEKFKLESGIVLFERVSIFILGIISLYLTDNIIYLAASFVVGRLITFLLHYYAINKNVRPIKWKFELKPIIDFQTEALPLGFATIVYGLYLQFDIVALSYFQNDIQVGYFAAAYKLYEGLLVIPLIITSVMYPRLSAYHENNTFKFNDLFYRSFKYMLIIGLLFGAIGLLFSSHIINILFGSQFQPASIPLTILLLSFLFFCLTSVMHMNFRSSGAHKNVLYTLTVGLGVKFIANLSFVESYSIVGSAYANLLAAIAMFLYASLLLLRKKQNVFAALTNIKILFASGISIAACLIIQPNNWVLTLSILFICYVIALFTFRIFDKYELNIISEICKKIIK